MAKLLLIHPHFKLQQIISNLLSTWQFWWQMVENLTKQVQRTFSMCKIRLSKAPIWLGSPGCAVSSTREAHWCARLSCPAHFWSVGRLVLSRFVPNPRSVSRFTSVLGIPAWESQEKGDAQREVGQGQAAAAGAPRPPARSSHRDATTCNQPQQPLPSKGHQLASFGDVYWVFVSSEESCLTPTINPPQVIFLYFWCL